MFVDITKIRIKAGNGGDGCTSFYTEKYVPDGGPDGGDGGAGGDIVFVADSSKSSLLDYRFMGKFKAGDGVRGSPKFCHGKRGDNLVLKVPTGTLIKDLETGGIIADMFEEGQAVTVLKGGRGGKGNARFKTSRRRAPHFSQSGERTEERIITLELKVIADAGLVGYPNAGKSTLLSVMTSARPKIADYHFTTLSPNLGVVDVFESSFVIADIPGLIEGAADGLGLGHEFLRHIERTRLLVHVVDASGREGRNPLDDFNNINGELKNYSAALEKLPQIVVLNKCDLLGDKDEIEKARLDFEKATGIIAVTVSGATGHGVKELRAKIALALSMLPPAEPIEFEPFVYQQKDKDSFEVEKLAEGYFEVSGGLIDELARNVVMSDYDSFNYLQRALRVRGITKALIKEGIKEGDTVRLLDMEFEYKE